LISESSTGGVGCVLATTLVVSLEDGTRGIVSLFESAALFESSIRCAIVGWTSGVALLADTSRTPEQANAEADAAAAIARVIFWKCILDCMERTRGWNLMRPTPKRPT
jgi:hypothetical protein